MRKKNSHNIGGILIFYLIIIIFNYIYSTMLIEKIKANANIIFLHFLFTCIGFSMQKLHKLQK